MIDLGKLLMAKEFAEIMSVTTPSVWRWIREGKIKAVKIGKTYRIPLTEIHNNLTIKEEERKR